VTKKPRPGRFVQVAKNISRCSWGESDPAYIPYHDKEWGVPVKNDRKMFEFLVLEGFQAGLSWITILKKRNNFRKAFDNFDPEKIASYSSKKIRSLLNDSGIVRNRLKINAAVTNAQAYFRIKEKQTFCNYFWDFMGGKPKVNRFKSMSQIPATTSLSDKISKDLKARGFKFVGSTIVYAHMQATGMVNDHIVSCFRHAQVVK